MGRGAAEFEGQPPTGAAVNGEDAFLQDNQRRAVTDADSLQRDFLLHYERNQSQALALRNRLVVVFGCGAVGSHVTAQLAHAGLNLTCVDHDVLELPNVTRHYLTDPRLVGQLKAQALARRLREELPALQRMRSVSADIRQLTDGHLHSLVEGAVLLVGATGHDDIDRRLNRIAREHTLPLVVPSLWAESPHGILGDLQIVPWALRNRACFECVRPAREVEPAEAQAQQGLSSEVQRVATLTAEVVLALLLTGTPAYRALAGQVERGATYFLIPRWPPSLRAVRVRRRLGCRACSAVRTRPISLTRNQPDPSSWRDWAVGLSLASAALWHQFVPGLDALATTAFIAVLGLWMRNRLPTREAAVGWFRRLFGSS